MKLFLFTSLVLLGCKDRNNITNSDWRIKGGTADGIQYSSLDQINKQNVKQLKIAWSYSTHDADTANNKTQIQCNPIVVNGMLFGTSAKLAAFAIDAISGKEIWKFIPDSITEPLGANRGVTYWEEGHDRRILFSFGEFLYALDARTGKRIVNFGNEGRVSLKEGLGKGAANLMVLSNSPGVIYKNLIIMGSRVHEGPISAPGHLRAFDVRSGKLVWVFHTIPQPGEFGYDTWPPDAWKRIGGANSWSGMTVDEQRGLVFASTGSASFDFYGGNRKGKNLFANCVLAIDAMTGKRKWHFQIVHHDLWDRDLPNAPLLATVHHDGKEVAAVVQTTKTGFVYLFDRETGEPLFPIIETPVPLSNLDGEEAWTTQPLPVKPPPFTRQAFTESMINHLVADTTELKEKFKSYKSGRSFIPPSKAGTIVFPGFDGGAGWGGSSFDPTSGILFVNSNEIPCVLTMVDVRVSEKSWAGISLYRTHCATCHGLDRLGDGKTYPSIDRLQKKYSKETLKQFIAHGKGAMPSFAHVNEKEIDAIARYVLDLEDRTPEEKKGFFERQSDVLYSNTGYTRFFTKEGYPAVEPPWGTLTAIDMNKGEILWQSALGEYKVLKEKGIPPTGTGNYGGPVATAGGLVFIAATHDEKIRAFDKDNGKVLWEADLPAAGYATPSVFQENGRQFLVIACGGGKLKTKSGDLYVAFALPSN